MTIGGESVPDGGIAAVVTGVESGAAASGAGAVEGAASGAGSDAVTGASGGATGAAGALATGGGDGADSDGIATGAAGALATGGGDGADSDGIATGAGGALASAGGGLNGTVTGGAVAVVGGCASELLRGLDAFEPGTPPVTLIESVSSAGAGCAMGAPASLGWPRPGRIEFPTVPSLILGTEDGDAIGTLALSLS
jgi:hypothetical protein